MGRRKADTVEQAVGDFGTDEARKRAFSVIEQPDPNDLSTRRVRVEQCMVDWYLRRNYLTQTQADALLRWQAHAYLAGLQPSCTASLDAPVSGSIGTLSDTRLAAQAQRDHAIKFLDAIDHKLTILIDAVALKGINAGRYVMNRWGASPGEGMEKLNRAANALARHFGLAR